MRYKDQNGEFIFSALIPGVGIILDAMCWRAVIGAGSYTVSTALSSGGFNNWSWSGLGQLMVIGAVSSAAFAGVGAITPSFTTAGTSFSGNLSGYLGKAGYATLAGMSSSTAGMLTADLMDDGKINNKLGGYFKGAAIAGITSGLISFGKSIYNYHTWDRYTIDEKIGILQKEFPYTPIEYGVKDANDFAAYSPFSEKITLTDKALNRSKSFARSIMAHETRHRLDDITTRKFLNKNSPNYEWERFKMIHDREVGGHEYFTEKNAYSVSISTANKYGLSYSEWKDFLGGARYYKIPQSNFRINKMPMIIRNIY